VEPKNHGIISQCGRTQSNAAWELAPKITVTCAKNDFLHRVQNSEHDWDAAEGTHFIAWNFGSVHLADDER
jgi:hypothetical protein